MELKKVLEESFVIKKDTEFIVRYGCLEPRNITVNNFGVYGEIRSYIGGEGAVEVIQPVTLKYGGELVVGDITITVNSEKVIREITAELAGMGYKVSIKNLQ